MSYSRWSNSNWYSFWNTSSGETKDSQVLSLWYVCEDKLVDLTYDELVDIKPSLLRKCYDSEISKKDLAEAMLIINWFIDDVDSDFEYKDKNEE
jgi:hypothetical protein